MGLKDKMWLRHAWKSPTTGSRIYFVRLLQLSVVRSDCRLIQNCTAEVDTLHIVNGVRMRTKSRPTWVLFAASVAIEVI